MCKLMGKDIQASAQIVRRTCEEHLPSVIMPGISGIINGHMVLIAEILQDDHGSFQSIPAFPSDLTVIIPGTAVVIQCQQVVILPVCIVRACHHHYMSFVVQELITVCHNDPALDIAQVIHTGTGIPHQCDRDILLCSVGQLYRPGVVHRFHELECVGSTVPGGSRFIPRNDRGHAVQKCSVHPHIAGHVGQIRTLRHVRVRIGAVHYPCETAFFQFLRCRIHIPVFREDNLFRPSIQDIRISKSHILRMLFHNLFSFICRDAFRGLLIRKVGYDAADQSDHIVIPVCYNLDRTSGYGCVGIHLLEHIIVVIHSIRQRAPGLKLHPFIPAERFRHRVYNSGGILYVFYRSVAAVSLNKINTAVFGSMYHGFVFSVLFLSCKYNC